MRPTKHVRAGASNRRGGIEQAQEVIWLEGGVELFTPGAAFAGLVPAHNVQDQPVQIVPCQTCAGNLTLEF